MTCRYFMAALLALFSISAAADVILSGVFPGRAAIIAVDGADPRSVRIGQTHAGITVISVDKDRAVIDANGKRRTLLIGQYTAAQGPREIALLSSDTRGHFFAQGSVNGKSVRFVVDTGATLIVLPAADARRLAIDYRSGQASTTRTANGPATAWRVKLDSVKVGDIELKDIDAAIIESGLDIALLGMSFLNRVEMHRAGQTMTLLKRF